MDALPSSSGEAANRRPRSLWEVATWGRDLGGIDAFLREFLDSFYLEQDADARSAMLSREPPLGEDERVDAYLAAVAEHLAFREPIAVPPWATRKARFLKRPFFPAGLESLKATLLVGKPDGFPAPDDFRRRRSPLQTASRRDRDP